MLLHGVPRMSDKNKPVWIQVGPAGSGVTMLDPAIAQDIRGSFTISNEELQGFCEKVRQSIQSCGDNGNLIEAVNLMQTQSLTKK